MYTINVDWLNQNALRNYPILDGASRASAGSAVLPNGLIVDLSMPVPIGSVEPGELFIQKVYGFSAGVVVALASIRDPSITLASASVFLDQHTANKSYPLVGSDSLSGVTGRITIGTQEALASTALGQFDFTSTPLNTVLVASVTRPLLRGLTGIVVQDSSGAVSDVLTGNVRIQAGTNVTVTADTNTNSVVINSGLTAASSTEEECGCNDSQEATQAPITSINGVFPDQNGNFTLAGFDCTEFKTIANGLQIVDNCTSPCCGCEQLTAVQNALQSVENSYTGLQEAAEQLRSRLDNLAHAMANASLNPPSSAQSSSVQWWYIPVTPDTGFITG